MPGSLTVDIHYSRTPPHLRGLQSSVGGAGVDDPMVLFEKQVEADISGPISTKNQGASNLQSSNSSRARGDYPMVLFENQIPQVEADVGRSSRATKKPQSLTVIWCNLVDGLQQPHLPNLWPHPPVCEWA